MSRSGGLENGMQDVVVDRDTADRLLAGRVDPDDAPPGYSEVAVLFRDLSDGLPEPRSEREAKTVAAMAEIVRLRVPRIDAPTSPRLPAKRGLFRVKILALVIVGTLAGTTGLAFAGALPGAAQDVASAVLAKIGITVPGPNSHAGSNPDSRGRSQNHAPADVSQPTGIETNASQQTGTKGSVISGIATTTTATGVDKGATISTAASRGRSQAGQHGAAAAHGRGAQRSEPGRARGRSGNAFGHSSITGHGRAPTKPGRPR